MVLTDISRGRAAKLGASAGVVIAAGIGALIVRDDVPERISPIPMPTSTSSTSTSTTVPPPVVPVSTQLASPNGEIAAYESPGGRRIGDVGVWYGYPMTMPILEEVDGWLRIMMPERPNGLTAWVRAEEVTRSTTEWRMVLTLSEFRVRIYKDGYEQWSSPVIIGKDSTRTPLGNYFVAVVERPGPPGFGPVVVDLNAHSEDIQSWKGSGDAITAFHGPFGSEAQIRAGGGKGSNGCLRMLPEDQLKLDVIPLGTPVDILP